MKTVTRRMTTSYTICNDGVYQYSFFADKAKNDINGNTRFSITVLLKESAITLRKPARNFRLKRKQTSS